MNSASVAVTACFLATSAAAEDVLVSMGFTNFYFDAAEDTAVGMIE